MSLIVASRSRTGNSRNKRVAVVRPPPASIVVRQAPSLPAQVVTLRTPKPRRNSRSEARISAPSAYGSVFQNQPPRFTGAKGSLRISHTEMFADELGTTSFSGVEFPMIPNSFKWLKTLAASFSRFRWIKLEVKFVTNSPTSQGGTVGLGAQYDGLDLVPVDMSEVSQMAHAWVGPVWSANSAGLKFDCSKWSKPYYPYNVNPVSLEDAVSYIPAKVFLGIQTQVNGQVIGRMMVDYTIELIDPIPARLNEAKPKEKERQDFTLPARFGAAVPDPWVDPQETLIKAMTALVNGTAQPVD